MEEARDRTKQPTCVDRLPSLLLFILIFSLAFMQPAFPLLGYLAVPTDFIFVGLAAAWLGLLASKRVPFVWDPAYAFIALYLLAMLLSVPTSQSPPASLVKLLTQLYLLSLPLVVCNVITREEQLKTAIRAWLAASAVMAAVGIVCLALFAADPHSTLLQFASFGPGSLPPGNYPRLQLTFMNPNLACDYLTVSVALLLAARQARWIDRAFWPLLGAFVVASLTTISPGIGGIALAIGLWCWVTAQKKTAGLLCLAVGTGVALMFVAAMAVTPIIHPTAPYLIRVPLLDLTLAPSGRLMVWTDAVRNFVAAPLTGRGIGIDPVTVKYLTPSGYLETLTDAHNVFLSIAVQCGAVGLAAFLLLLVHVVRRTLPLRLEADPASIVRVGIGIGLIVGLAYEGLGGSFEDARHLWVALGLLLASDRISARAVESRRQIASISF